MSLPTRVTDRLFDRLAATYGSQWLSLWAALPIGEVKGLWAFELAPFAERLDAIAWALENLPERPPNLVAFKALCRQAPRTEPAPLPEPPADPERIRQVVATLREATASDPQRQRSGRNPAEILVDGLIERASTARLSSPQADALRRAVKALRADDTRRHHPAISAYLPGSAQHDAQPIAA
jgi:hypothetical protein